MPRPFTTSQIERLGLRLGSTSPRAAEDIAQLHVLLAGYASALEKAVARVSAVTGLAPSSRVKNTGTILEKLERQGGASLKSMQDLGGMRIVRSKSRDEQDAIVAQVVELFSAEARAPRVIDRRERPVEGYRAVHVVVFPDAFPIEIQVRTRMQHEWAELFEKLADIFGRGIRYGEPPQHWVLSEPTPINVEADWWDDVQTKLGGLVRTAQQLSALLAASEIVEQSGADTSGSRTSIAEALIDLGKVVEIFEQLDPPIEPA